MTVPERVVMARSLMKLACARQRDLLSRSELRRVTQTVKRRSSGWPISRQFTQAAWQAHSCKPPSRKAFRPCTSTSCSAQRQNSSDQQYGPSHQPCGSNQHSSPDQHNSPNISLLSPVLQRQWDHAKNAPLGHILIKPHTAKKVWWRCDQCPVGQPHEWEAQVKSRSLGTSCPFCTNKRACQHNSLATKHPDLAAEFSPRHQGTAHDYTAGSGQEVLWRCKYGHEYTAAIRSRTTNQTGCRECFTIRQSLQPQQRHPVLADSPHPVMHLWDAELNAKQALDPNKLRCRSNQVCNWICRCCPKGRPHRWRASPGALYVGSGCPCCSGRKACICNSLQSLYPDLAAEWDYTRNIGTPDDYPAHSHKRVWWCTPKRSSFQAMILDRTRLLSPNTTI